MAAPNKRVLILGGIIVVLGAVAAVSFFGGGDKHNATPQTQSRADEINKSMQAEQSKEKAPPPPPPPPPGMHRGSVQQPKSGG